MNELLYREELLDHYRHPRNYGQLEGSQATVQVSNPSCGDQVTMNIYIEDGHLNAIAFQGKGCVVSQAAASMLSEFVKFKALDDILRMDRTVMLSLLGIQLGPTRMRCGLLALEALHKAIHMYAGERDA